MITVTNRLPTKPNRWKITHESDSSEEYVVLEHADEPTTEGTPINKALLEGIQNDLMSNTELIVAEYTANSDVSSVEFTDLDFEADGGLYEIIISGNMLQYVATLRMLLQLNNITSGYYYNLSTSTNSSNSSTGLVLETAFKDYVQVTAKLTRIGNKYLLSSISTATDGSTSGSIVYTHLVSSYVTSSSNVTSMTFLSNDAGNKIKKGTNIKIIKRR